MSIDIQSGVWGVTVTPFNGSTFEVDEGSLAGLVEHYDRVGVVGLTVLGVLGEALALSTDEKRSVLEAVVDTVDLPLIVGTSALQTAPVIEEIRLAAEVTDDRLAAAMVQVNSADPAILAGHLTAIHQATGASLVVQDYPVASGVHIAPHTLVAALRDLSFVVGVKEEAPPTPTAISVLTGALDVPVFGGLGGIQLLDELAVGAAGAMTGFSFPEALVECVNAFSEGGYEAAKLAIMDYLPLVNFEQQTGIALAIRKECLRRRGLIMESSVRPPSLPMPEALVDQVRAHLASLPKNVAVV